MGIWGGGVYAFADVCVSNLRAILEISKSEKNRELPGQLREGILFLYINITNKKIIDSTS